MVPLMRRDRRRATTTPPLISTGRCTSTVGRRRTKLLRPMMTCGGLILSHISGNSYRTTARCPGRYLHSACSWPSARAAPALGAWEPSSCSVEHIKSRRGGKRSMSGSTTLGLLGRQGADGTWVRLAGSPAGPKTRALALRAGRGAGGVHRARRAAVAGRRGVGAVPGTRSRARAARLQARARAAGVGALAIRHAGNYSR